MPARTGENQVDGPFQPAETSRGLRCTFGLCKDARTGAQQDGRDVLPAVCADLEEEAREGPAGLDTEVHPCPRPELLQALHGKR